MAKRYEDENDFVHKILQLDQNTDASCKTFITHSFDKYIEKDIRIFI